MIIEIDGGLKSIDIILSSTLMFYYFTRAAIGKIKNYLIMVLPFLLRMRTSRPTQPKVCPLENGEFDYLHSLKTVGYPGE